jgi:hypothetical protein
MSEQKPSIGRIVIYKLPDAEPERNGTREHPAIITRVWTDDCVNLTVFFDATHSEPRTSQQRSAGRWDWPVRV